VPVKEKTRIAPLFKTVEKKKFKGKEQKLKGRPALKEKTTPSVKKGRKKIQERTKISLNMTL